MKPGGCRDRCLHLRKCLDGTSEENISVKEFWHFFLHNFVYLREKLDHWRFVRVLLTELEGQLKCPILKIDFKQKWGSPFMRISNIC